MGIIPRFFLGALFAGLLMFFCVWLPLAILGFDTAFLEVGNTKWWVMVGGGVGTVLYSAYRGEFDR